MKKSHFCLLCLLCLHFPFQFVIAQEQNENLKWMQASLPAVPEWNAWQQKTGELPPDFSKLKKSNLLPDPFQFNDGRIVGNMSTDWPKRRSEILQLFEKYVTGSLPPKPSITNIVQLDETKGQGCLVRNVRVEFGPQGKGSVRIRLVIPDAPDSKKFPVMISPSLSGWSTPVIRRGYIAAGYAGNDAMDDAAPLKDLYPGYDFATLPRRAWLAAIVIDYLATIPQVEMEHIAINGYSRDGKMATMAAAFDKRIAAVVAGSTGVGGMVPWRFAGERGGGEGIETTTRNFPTWFIHRLRYFSGHENYLPVDANLLLALIAPRAVLMQWGYTDQVANGWAMEQAYLSAQKVYERLGQPKKLGLLAVPGFHGSNDQEACMDWLDLQFGRTKKEWNNHIVFPWDFNKWQAESGEKNNVQKLPVKNIAEPIAASKAEWDKKVDALLTSIKWMLGDVPPFFEATDNAFRGRPGVVPAGPTEIGKGTVGNPGQLAPDVPSWVISNGGGSYGWRAPEKNEVASRRIRFRGVTGDLYYPANTPKGKQLKTVIWLHGFHYPLGYMWVYRSDLHPILALAKAGYAVLAYDQTGFGTRWSEAEHFYERFPHWSQMGKMMEDLHNAVDVLEKDSMVDAKNISVYGFSMGGALALYAAALDKRIAGVVAVAGFTPMRTDTPNKGMSGMTRYSHLHGLVPRLGFFAGHESKLPYDFDDMMALIAPRPVLIVQPSRDRDADPAAVRNAVNRAQKIYSFNNATNKLELQEPDDYGRFTDATQEKAIEWMKNNF
ncbi:MAG: alpha/beta fold hydrolase [Bacteroidota bacterium]